MAQAPVWLNGTLVPWSSAQVSVLSHGMQRGALVFDVGALRPGRRGPLLFRAREHIARFLRSAALVGHCIDWDEVTLLRATVDTARASGTDSALVRWSAFVPTLEADVVPRCGPASSVAIAVITSADAAPEGATKPESVRVVVPDDVRKAGPEVFPPQAKVAAAYLGPMLAKRRALASGFDEVVLLDGEGRVAEAPTANVFVVREGSLVTPPPERVLAGITRDSVLAIARAEGILAREEHLTLNDLRHADEAFLVSTSLPVQAISSVNGRSVRGGSPGPVTARIRAAVQACERGEGVLGEGWVEPV